VAGDAGAEPAGAEVAGRVAAGVLEVGALEDGALEVGTGEGAAVVAGAGVERGAWVTAMTGRRAEGTTEAETEAEALAVGVAPA
jgi:hypothetical protein